VALQGQLPSGLRLEADAGAMEQHLVVQISRPDGPKRPGTRYAIEHSTLRPEMDCRIFRLREARGRQLEIIVIPAKAGIQLIFEVEAQPKRSA
jgi:hypothetical protein